MTEAGELVHAEEAREALFASLTPWIDTLKPQLPPEAARLRALVALQLWPTMGRLILIGERTNTVAEVARATEEDLPGCAGITEALETFVAAGTSAMSPEAARGALESAARPGWGYVALLDPLTGSARCLLAPRGVGLDRALLLFEIVPEGRETVH